MKRGALGERVAFAAGKVSERGLKLALFAGVSSLTIASFALANPQGGEVVQGGATITTPNTTTTQIDQSTDKAVINWKTFNVGTGESAIFNQPNAASVTLNRIFDQDPSIIAGLVSANGRLILINANGMVFENGASVNTAGLIATTADISNSDFMAGNYRFETPGAANASIVNKGVITADEGGVVAFVAPHVRNSGVITAKLGQVSLGAGNTFVLDLYGDNLISFPVSAEIAQQLVGPDGKPLTALVEAGGKIEAGSVQLTARAARGIIDNVINVDGEIIASGVRQAGGSTFLTGAGSGAVQDDSASAKVDGLAGSNSGAGGVNGVYGGRIVIDGDENNVNLAGSLSASGTTGGGAISVTGNNVYAGGSISANGGSGQGGSVAINAGNFASMTGSISANGASGGAVTVNASSILIAGSVSADGSSGAGGLVSLTAQQQQIATSATQISASGTTGGGVITIAGGGSVFTSGTYKATSSAGAGGNVTFGGGAINMIDSKVDASGATAGGAIAVGFTGAGDARAINAEKVLVSPTSMFNADATQSGDGGSVVFWSNLATDFMGTITAKGGSLAGDGGFLEVSSKGEVGFWGLGDASAANGASGQLLLDPKNIVISTSGTSMPSYELVDPGSGDNSFGANVAVLANGNTAVTSSGNDTVASNAGAAMLFNTTTGALISMVTGSRANDAVGSGGITVLPGGNFVVASANWDNGAGALDAGAVTYVNGTTGLAGVVSSANSLVGSAGNMNVGSGGVTVLSNGNYVVASPNWDNGGTANVGAVTLGNGATGTFGNVTTGNSLIGSTTNDNVGSGGVVALTNGNYVVRSMLWNNGVTADVGAATWRSGTNFAGATVGAANSIIGSTANDQVGSSGVTALSNGNYVVASALWNNGGTADVGAVTWGNGATGTFATVGAGNSLIGSQTNDNVGNGGVVALSNGNYVVISTLWNSGGTADVGAVTWRNGSAASSGTVASANSFVGSATNDQIGSNGVVALTNGNYVVSSSLWNNGGSTDAGAVTWGNGTNGQFMTTGFGALGAANSLVGTASNHNVGSGGAVALSNGNYVAVSPNWDNGGTTNVGAVTWGNGATGTAGSVGTGNSLVGTNSNDNVGSGGVVALTNGNYVVASPSWTNGGDTDTGAVTWRNGTGANATTVQTGNSLFGNEDNDNVGAGGIVALANGSFVVSSPFADFPSGGFGTDTDAGAVTLGNGTNGQFMTGGFGGIGSANSVIGDDDDDEFRFAGVGANGEILYRNLNDGEVFVGLTDPNQLTFARAQGATLTVNPAFLTRTLNTGTAVTVQASNDLTVQSDIVVSNASGDGGALTLQAGRSVLIDDNVDIVTDNGNLTIVANELLANGVINAQRDAGAATLTMDANATINAGTGNVVLRIASGAGKTNLTSGDMTLRSITASTILAENLGTTAGSDIILASGVRTATGAGTPLVLASQSGNFINNAGAGALATPNGRWIVYSQTPTANTLGGLAGTSWYNNPYNPADPTGLSATGNRFAYTIAPTLTVTANNQTREYGEPNSSLTFGVTGLLGADTLAGAVQGAPDLQTTATQASAAGSAHSITATIGTLASAYNYGFAMGPAGTLTIAQAQLFYAADPMSREYGDPNGVLTGSLTGLKNGELLEDVTDGTMTFTGGADNLSNVGIYGITGSGLTVTSGNYQVNVLQNAANATALTVTQAQLYYLADQEVRTYGDTDDNVDGIIFGLKNGQSLGDITEGDYEFTTTVNETTGAGVYAILGSGTLNVIDSNYAPVVLQHASNATAYTVNQAQLFYIADSEEREYGDENPLFSGTLDGFVNDDETADVVTGTMVFSSSATSSSNAGFHAINGSGLTIINPNYAITILQDVDNATALTVTPAELTYLANPAIRIYGDPNPTLTGTVTGLKNGDTLESVASGALTFTSPATPTSNVGDYDIVGGGLTVTSGNYLLTIVQDDENTDALEIIQAQLFYAADAKTITYGDLIPTLTGTIQGFKNGDTIESVLFGSLIWQTEADNGDGVGVYAIEGDGLVVLNPNYLSDIDQLGLNDIALRINPALLTYVADPKSQLYGLPAPALTGTLTGLRNGDALDDVTTGVLGFTSAAPPFSQAGVYAINGGGLTVTDTNYITTILQDPGNATAYEIQPIPDTVSQAKVDGTKAPESATDQDQNDMSSRSNELGIMGVSPVVDDMKDGQNDELPAQLCVLGAPEAANAPGCVVQQQLKGR